jgi:alpha-galactosidase
LAGDLGIEVPEEFTGTHASPSIIPFKNRVARQAVELVDIKAAGLNHFTWMLDLRDRRTGEDLYPLFAERWADLDPSFEPLTRRVYEAFGLFPIPGDEHLCEYLPWVSDPVTEPWKKFDLSLYEWDLWDQLRGLGHADIAQMADGKMTVDHLLEADSEGALEMIENVAGAGNHYHLAVNLPNQGYIPNLPAGAIAEVPGLVSGVGVQGVGVGPLPEPVAELCRRELAAVRLCVDAAVHGDRRAALQCLLLDPVITDMDVAKQILDDYLETYREHLPQFWQ